MKLYIVFSLAPDPYAGSDYIEKIYLNEDLAIHEVNKHNDNEPWYFHWYYEEYNTDD